MARTFVDFVPHVSLKAYQTQHFTERHLRYRFSFEFYVFIDKYTLHDGRVVYLCGCEQQERIPADVDTRENFTLRRWPLEIELFEREADAEAWYQQKCRWATHDYRPAWELPPPSS